MRLQVKILLSLLTSLAVGIQAYAKVYLPSVFSEHMVLQREQANPVWGIASPGESVTVQIASQSHTAVAGSNKRWRVQLDPMPAGGPYTLKVSGSNTIDVSDVMVGEVWFCSGQSNMEFALKSANNGGVILATSENPQIRLLTIPHKGTPTPQENFEGQWGISSPETAADFSAVGYLFGQRLQAALGVTIGLIDNSWGGSTAEAWVPRNALEASGDYQELLEAWDTKTDAYTNQVHASKVSAYKAWVAAGKPKPEVKWPKDPRYDQFRPANIYNGMVHPLLGYGIRGVIWYQGEANTKRAYQYRKLFPLVINTWRDLWQQDDFPFYWVQIANFTAELPEPADSSWAELREAQTMALSLPNTGQAVIIDCGENRDVHPRDKQTVADRLVRHALTKTYGFDIACESPSFKSMHIDGDQITLSFDHTSKGLYAFDTKEVRGFSIAGIDRKFVWADAEIIGKDQVRISSTKVPSPVAVRYAWAHNPDANLQDRNGLQVTPFRTDDWPISTMGAVK